jgi:hypothetical protein
VFTNATGTAMSQTVTSSAIAQMIAQAFAGNPTAISTYNQTPHYNHDVTGGGGNAAGIIIGDAAGSSSSVPFTAIGNSSQPWGAIAVPLIPAT